MAYRRGKPKRKGRKASQKPSQFWVYEHLVGGKIYVGLTARNVRQRLEEHIESAREGSQTPFHVALRENDYKCVTTSRKHSSEKAMAKDEVDTIAKYKEEGIEIYNKTAGGECARGVWRYKGEEFTFTPKKTKWKGRYNRRTK